VCCLVAAMWMTNISRQFYHRMTVAAVVVVVVSAVVVCCCSCYCTDHRPQQSAPSPRKRHRMSPTCAICMTELESLIPDTELLLVPCCQRQLLHRECLQVHCSRNNNNSSSCSSSSSSSSISSSSSSSSDSSISNSRAAASGSWGLWNRPSPFPDRLA